SRLRGPPGRGLGAIRFIRIPHGGNPCLQAWGGAAPLPWWRLAENDQVSASASPRRPRAVCDPLRTVAETASLCVTIALTHLADNFREPACDSQRAGINLED